MLDHRIREKANKAEKRLKKGIVRKYWSLKEMEEHMKSDAVVIGPKRLPLKHPASVTKALQEAWAQHEASMGPAFVQHRPSIWSSVGPA